MEEHPQLAQPLFAEADWLWNWTCTAVAPPLLLILRRTHRQSSVWRLQVKQQQTRAPHRVCLVQGGYTILTIESRGPTSDSRRSNQQSALAQREISTPTTRQGEWNELATPSSSAADAAHLTRLNTARAWQHDCSKREERKKNLAASLIFNIGLTWEIKPRFSPFNVYSGSIFFHKLYYGGVR